MTTALLASPTVAFASFGKSTAGAIESVVWEPNEAEATRVRLIGVFATLLSEVGGFKWTAPSYGYLYYTCPEGKEEACRAEWKEIVKVDEIEGCVAFGANIFENVRPINEPPENPDTYLFVDFGTIYKPIDIECHELVADTPPMCGNGVIEAGEVCDGDCLTECEPISETVATGCGHPEPDGSPSECNVICSYQDVIFGCIDDDGCCRWLQCGPEKDTDCADGGPKPDPPDDPPDAGGPEPPTPDAQTEPPSAEPEPPSVEPEPPTVESIPSPESGGCVTVANASSSAGLLSLLAIGLLLGWRRHKRHVRQGD